MTDALHTLDGLHIGAVMGVHDPELRNLLSRHWEAAMANNPVWATMLGDRRYAGFLPDHSAEGERQGRHRRAMFLEEARQIDAATLDPQDQLTLALFIEEAEVSRFTDVCAFPTWVVSGSNHSLSGFMDLAVVQPVRSGSDAQHYLARIRALPALVDQDAARLVEGAADGRTGNAASVADAITAIEAELARPLDEWPLLDVLDDPDLAGAPEGWADALRVEVDSELRAALTRYRDTLRDRILPLARPPGKEGVIWLPDGAACYAATIREHTSRDRSPDEIHAVGLAEMARIHTEMAALGQTLWGTPDLPVIFERLRTDPALRFEDGTQIVAKAEATLARAQQAAPTVIGHLPQADCKVSIIPDYEAPYTYVAYYKPPQVGGKKPGEYFVNTFAPETRLRHEAEVLAFHESVPGHHVQVALSQELPGVPAFRRHMGLTVFVEGWALYTERLADELGLYTGDLDRMGMLAFDAWRAGRLVVDTGIHGMGWSREQAERYLLDNTPLAPNNIHNEVDRYINWPGQALGYKLGQIEIMRMREEARAALGDAFDLRAFHDVVLGAGALPMPILEARVKAWVASQ